MKHHRFKGWVMRKRIKQIVVVAAVVLGALSLGANASGSPNGKDQRIAAPVGICCHTTVKWAAWVHHAPRVYTSPQYVFIAQPSDNLAAVCYILGDTYNGRALWYLVIDRNQDNAVGYVNAYEINEVRTAECGSS